MGGGGEGGGVDGGADGEGGGLRLDVADPLVGDINFDDWTERVGSMNSNDIAKKISVFIVVNIPIRNS